MCRHTRSHNSLFREQSSLYRTHSGLLTQARTSNPEPMRSRIASQYATQYATDHQMNPHQIAFALVNKQTGERIEHMSNAQANKP